MQLEAISLFDSIVSSFPKLGIRKLDQKKVCVKSDKFSYEILKIMFSRGRQGVRI